MKVRNIQTRWRPIAKATSRLAGFTVLEFVAMLAVLAILATAVSTHVFNRLRDEARKAEQASLREMARAFKVHVRETRRIPALEEIPEFIALELEQPVAKVLQTANGQERVFLYDPNFKVGPTGEDGPPYEQTADGSVEPQNARLLIVSRLDGPVPETLDFEQLWELEPGALPAGVVGDPEDFFFQRIDLKRLFHRVVLASTDPTRDGPYDFNTTTDEGEPEVRLVPALGRTEVWLIEGTPITFYSVAEDLTSTLQAREFVREDTSYVFERGLWSRHAYFGNGGWKGSFGTLAEVFLNAPVNPEALYNTTPADVVNEMYNYLRQAGLWGRGVVDPDTGEYIVPPYDSAGSPDQPVSPLHVLAWDAQKRLVAFTLNLIN